MLQTKYLRRRVQTALSSRLSVVAASAVLVAVASTLIWLMRIHDADEYFAALDAIVMVQRQQAAWNVELARTRSDPQSNFDALAEFARQTIQLKARILAAIRRLPDLPRPVRERARNLVDALEAKKNHTESFKRHYAVVRNATRYLPIGRPLHSPTIRTSIPTCCATSWRCRRCSRVYWQIPHPLKAEEWQQPWQI